MTCLLLVKSVIFLPGQVTHNNNQPVFSSPLSFFLHSNLTSCDIPKIALVFLEHVWYGRQTEFGFGKYHFIVARCDLLLSISHHQAACYLSLLFALFICLYFIQHFSFFSPYTVTVRINLYFLWIVLNSAN